MVGLDRGDEAELPHALDVLRPQVLGVLDPPAPVPWPVPADGFFIEVENDRIRPVADGVDGELEACFVRGLDPFLHDSFRIHVGAEQALQIRVVGVGLEKQGSGTSQGPVDEAFQPPDFEKIVSERRLQPQARIEVHLAHRNIEEYPGSETSSPQEFLVDLEV